MSDVLTLISEPAPHLLDFPEKDYCSNLFKRMELRENPVNFTDPTGLTSMVQWPGLEPQAKKTLESIQKNPDNFVMNGYKRKALKENAWDFEVLKHTFYTITDLSTKEVSTLSFNGTKLGQDSEGAWAFDTDTDVDSLNKYNNGTNEWEAVDITPGNGIDVSKTASNILDHLDSDTTYDALDSSGFFRPVDIVKGLITKKTEDNCNSAYKATVTENKKEENK